MNRKRGGRGSFIKGGKRGVGSPCAALERKDFQKVTLSNLFYLSLEVRRDKVNMIFALVQLGVDVLEIDEKNDDLNVNELEWKNLGDTGDDSDGDDNNDVDADEHHMMSFDGGVGRSSFQVLSS
ncbi:hypothetical protein VNO77_42003 [Canavalia gladiata]|uniref:Uncharacterized protein n=1 Tax=Canavalia gladiata TaxID=3824 RepID=A0AAN9K1K2_CANGL